MRLYRVVHAGSGVRYRMEGIDPDSDHDLEDRGRIYFWDSKQSAKDYARYLIHEAETDQGRPKRADQDGALSILTVDLPEGYYTPEEDPSPVVERFGHAYFSMIWVEPQYIVGETRVRA